MSFVRRACAQVLATQMSRTPRSVPPPLSTGVWCVLGFGAGFEIALKPSKLQK